MLFGGMFVLWGGVALLCGGIAVHLVINSWARLKRVERESRYPPGLSDELAQRLARIEQIVESTAIEVERVSEAQRYVARQVADATAARIPSPRSAERVNTPH